jgi:hypothetical protein
MPKLTTRNFKCSFSRTTSDNAIVSKNKQFMSPFNPSVASALHAFVKMAFKAGDIRRKRNKSISRPVHVADQLSARFALIAILLELGFGDVFNQNALSLRSAAA